MCWIVCPGTSPVCKTPSLDAHHRSHLIILTPGRQDEPEYYPIGHDMAESLFDERLAAKSDRNSSLSFLLCGIGDARHLLATLNSIAMNIDQGEGGLPKELHFTLVDLKPASLARILILLELSSQLSPAVQFGSQACDDATCVLAYLYIGHVVPPFVHAALLRTISSLIRVLEKKSKKSPLLKWVVMADATREQVLDQLRLWSRPLDDLYQPENVRKLVEINIHRAKMGRFRNGLMAEGPPIPLTCEEDEATFDQFTITPPPEAFVTRHEPELGRLVDDMRSETRPGAAQASKFAKLDEYINQNWKTNMTLIDLVWEGKKERNNHIDRPSNMEWTRLTGMEGEHVNLLQHISGDMEPEPLPGHKGVIDMMGLYFLVVGTSLGLLRSESNLRVEMIAGEMTDTMERFRYGCLDDRHGRGSSVSFPERFDRIHMSNIP